jgi:polyhydroxybutyrate depolymerase
MKKLLLLLCLSGAISTTQAQLTNKTLNVGSASRTYKQYLPSGLDPGSESVSVIIALHGLGGTNADIVSTGLNDIADTARIIVFYPQGLVNNYGQTSWNNGTLLSTTSNDIGFMSQLMDTAILNYNADPSRVYVTGFSMGSIMSYHLACTMNDRVAAIGCMSGTMSTSDINTCAPAYVTPVIHFHGTADGTVPYDANALPSLSLVPQTIAFWKTKHTCDATADSTQLTNLAADGYTVDRFVYDNCEPAASLEHWRINGANHEYFYIPNNDFDEITETWLFMRKWQHSNPASAGIEENEFVNFTVAPNPSNGNISIECDRVADYTVYGMTGSKLISGKLMKGSNLIQLSGLSSGMYLISVNGTTQHLVIN